MWNRTWISEKTITVNMIVIIVVITSCILADGEQTLNDEVESTGESDGHQTPTDKMEEINLTGQFETTNRFEQENGGIFSSRKRHTQGTEETSDVAVLEITFGDATKAGLVTTASVQIRHSSEVTERALTKQSSSKWNGQVSQPETVVVSSLMQTLSPQLSSWENHASPNGNPSSYTIKTSRGFVALSSSTTSQEALSKKTSSVVNGQLSVFTDKTMLSSAVTASSFIALSQSNLGQVNHASESSSGSAVGLLLSRQHLDKISTGMKQEIKVTKTSKVLIKETLSLTHTKLWTRASLSANSVNDVTFRSTPATGVKIQTSSTLPDRSRNSESSGTGEIGAPSAIGHSISTALLSSIPLLSSSPAVTVRQSHDQFSRTAVTSLLETGTNTTDTAIGMTVSVIRHPSAVFSSVSANESRLAPSSMFGSRVIRTSADDSATLSEQIFSSSQTKSKPDLTESSIITTQEDKSKVESILVRNSSNLRTSIRATTTRFNKTVDLPLDSVRTLISREMTRSFVKETVHQVETLTLFSTVNVSSALVMVEPSSSAASLFSPVQALTASATDSRKSLSMETSHDRTQALNSSSQITKSTKKYADKKTLSVSQVSHRRTAVVDDSSSLVKPLSSKNFIIPSSSTSRRMSVKPSTAKTLLESRGRLRTSLTSSVVVSSSREPSQSQLLLITPASTISAPGPTTKPALSALFSTSKASVTPSATTVLLPSREKLHGTSLLSSVAVSRTTESLPMSLKSRILLQTSPKTLVGGSSKSSKVSKLSRATVVLQSHVIASSSTTEYLLMSSKSESFPNSSFTPVSWTIMPNGVSAKPSTTAVLLPSQEVLNSSLSTYVELASSTIEPLLMSSKSPLMTPVHNATLTSSLPGTMNTSHTVKTSQAKSFSSWSSVNVSGLSGLKSSELSWVIGSPKSSSTTTVIESRKEATSVIVSQVMGSHSHSFAEDRVKLTTPSSQQTLATADISVAPSSDKRRETLVRVNSASFNQQSSLTVLTTDQPAISLAAGMSSRSRQILPRSSFVVRQRTSVSSALSRDKDLDQTSVIPEPLPALTTHRSPSSTLIEITPKPSFPGPKLKSAPSSHVNVLIVVATVPSVFLGIIIAILICRHRGRHRRNNTLYSIKVEYTDEVRRRRKRANSRLDLAVHGIHIDLEFPTSADSRDSVRFSRGTHLNEGQIRELQLLSQECNQRLEWLNEVLTKEVVSPFSGTDSGILFRDSTFESGGKLVRRESSKRSRDNFKLKRLLSRDRNSSGEHGEDSKKESIEIKALPTTGGDAAEETSTSNNCKAAERSDSKKEVKLSPEGETTETAEPRSAGNETEDTDIASTPGNKMRYYPLARTRNESTRSRFETL